MVILWSSLFLFEQIETFQLNRFPFPFQPKSRSKHCIRYLLRIPDDPAISNPLGGRLLFAAVLHRYRLPGKLQLFNFFVF